MIYLMGPTVLLHRSGFGFLGLGCAGFFLGFFLQKVKWRARLPGEEERYCARWQCSAGFRSPSLLDTKISFSLSHIKKQHPQLLPIRITLIVISYGSNLVNKPFFSLNKFRCSSYCPKFIDWFPFRSWLSICLSNQTDPLFSQFTTFTLLNIGKTLHFQLFKTSKRNPTESFWHSCYKFL